MTIEITAEPSSDFDFEDAFLKSFDEPAEKPRKEAPEEPVEAPEAPAESTPTGEAEKTAEAPSTAPSDDDDEVELPIGGETKTFKLKDVRAALELQSKGAGAPSAEVSAQVQAQTARATTALNKVIEQAKARYEPFANVDWLALSRDPTIPQEDFVALRAEALQAYQELESYTKELDGLTAESRTAQAAGLLEAQKAAVKVLMDPEKGIKGFSKPLYEELMAFADASGLQGARGLVDPAAIKLLHQAMLFQRGQTKADTQIKKVTAQPSRVIRPSGSGKSGSGTDRASAVKAMRSSNSIDSVADAFFADLNK